MKLLLPFSLDGGEIILLSHRPSDGVIGACLLQASVKHGWS